MRKTDGNSEKLLYSVVVLSLLSVFNRITCEVLMITYLQIWLLVPIFAASKRIYFIFKLAEYTSSTLAETKYIERIQCYTL